MTTPSILLVDDDADICENMADILLDRGFRVDIAHEGITALRLVRGNSYDVALLDLKMPGMDGLTLYHEIKKVRTETVAMLVTAYAAGSTAEEAIAAGAWQVLAKPVDLPRLLGLIDKALELPLVLVVDDDAELCTNLVDILRERGYRVCIATDGATAAERLRGSPRVVLLDLMLPDGDGAELFRQFRETNAGARVILITGLRAETHPIIERLQVEGIDAICYKPLDIPALLETLDQLSKS